MFVENESVMLTHNIDEYGLKEGTVGVVVFVYENGEAYEVEFMTPEGRTIGILTLTSTDLRSNAYKEVLDTSWVTGNLNYSALGTAYYPIENNVFMNLSGVATVPIVNTESNKEESRTKMFSYQTV